MSINKNDSVVNSKFYKVIEERMSPTGKAEYWTLPLYEPITKDEIEGKCLFQAKESRKEKVMRKFSISTGEENYVHAFSDLDSAVFYMESNFKGYPYTRPVIFECECAGPLIQEKGNAVKCKEMRFVKPLLQMVDFKTSEYSKISVPEKKKFYGIQYREEDINGDVDGYSGSDSEAKV